MTSRERVLAAFDHQEADRVPIDLSGHRSSGMSATLYPKVRRLLGLPERPTYVYDPIQQLAIVDEDVLDRFGIDTIELGRGFCRDDQWWVDWELPDGTPCKMPAWAAPERGDGRWILRSVAGTVLAKMPDGALYFEQANWPFADEDDLDHIPEAMDETMWCALRSPPGPLPPGKEGSRRLREGAVALRASTDRAVVGLFGGNLFELGQFLYGMEGFLALLAGDPIRAHAFLDRAMELHLASLERFMAAVGDAIDVVVFGDDLGMTTGPLISPRMYREFFRPRHARLWSRSRELSDARIMLHSCGGIRELLPDLIEAGLEGTNPVQTNCAGMDPAELKREFGRDLVFWGGGCDTAHVLPHGTPAQVAEHVRERVRTLAPGGGFVFQQVHNILSDVPPANVVAMLDAIADARR